MTRSSELSHAQAQKRTRNQKILLSVYFIGITLSQSRVRARPGILLPCLTCPLATQHRPRKHVHQAWYIAMLRQRPRNQIIVPFPWSIIMKRITRLLDSSPSGPPNSHTAHFMTHPERSDHVYAPCPVPGIGQSSSVILDQNTQMVTTERRVNRVSNMPPLILPLVPLQMWTLATYWKIWPMAKRRAAAIR